MKGKPLTLPQKLQRVTSVGRSMLFGGGAFPPPFRGRRRGTGVPKSRDVPGQPTPPDLPPPPPAGSPVIVGAEVLALSQHRPVQI